jgi:hypothetical protein
MSDLNEVEKGQLCQSTIESLYEATGGMKQFPGLLKKIIATKAWERRISKGKVVELSSLRELITEKPVRGWGEDIETVRAVIASDVVCCQMFDEAITQKHGGDRKSKDAIKIDNVKLDPSTGNSKAYTLSRLKRENEELFEAVVAGELSANAAAIKAGFRKKPTDAETCVKSWRKTDSRLSVLKVIASTLEPHEWEYLIGLRDD